MTKEQHEWFARFWGRLAQKIHIFHMFFIVFSLLLPSFMPKSESLKLLFAQSLFFKEQRERFALVHLYKRAIAIKSLPLPFTTERLWAFRSGRSWQKSNGSNSLFFTSESLFHLQKTSNSLEKAMSEFPTLHLLEHVVGVPVVLLACSVDVTIYVPESPEPR